MRGWLFLISLIALIAGASFTVNASHIAGGQISYTCTGNNQYRIELVIYQDCVTGEPTAISEDTPAFIGVFNLDTRAGSVGQYRPVSRGLVPPNFNNACVKNVPVTCLSRLTFVINTFLPPNTSGYRVVYQRCCRNASTLNIFNPDQTGATYFIDIPPQSLAPCNNSADFKIDPPQIICINNPLIYDHSAEDADKDSLSYEFCTAYEGGSLASPKPTPSPLMPGALKYVAGYSATKPMGGNPVIQIDPKTGLITGTPTTQGRFVVTVCCHEWRNGVVINTVHREFQFVVTNCSKAVVANIPQYSDEFNTYIVKCDGYTVGFKNLSTGGFSYDWDFGVPGATSNDFEPTYTYPDTGTYTVKLIVNKGSTCPDSISRFVKVYPTFKTDYEYNGLHCPSTPIQFTDKSEATYNPITQWEWSFGDGATSVEQNPSHAYVQGGDYPVTLISKSIKGCRDTAIKTLFIERFRPFAGNDTIIVKGEYINFNATGGVSYLWTPGDGLIGSNTANPRGYYPDTGRYAYNVHITSVNGCQGDDSIKVWVVNDAVLTMPNAFTPNGDGLNDYIKPMTVGISDIQYFRIFNRWGEMVYDTGNFETFGWDGTYKGQKAEMGTYFWVLGVTDRFGKDQVIKGDLTLVR